MPLTSGSLRDGSDRRVCAQLALSVACALAMTVAASPGRAATAYPGGTWEPPAPSFGVFAETDVAIPMDDGVSLVADVYYPADLSSGARAPGDFPVLLTQTPYSGAGGVLGGASGDYFVERGYIFVSVDIRGTGRSGGNGGFFSPRDADDGVLLVAWAASDLDGSNGVVGLQGCSYLGLTQLATAWKLGPGSPVKAMIPACVSSDPYRDVYMENGIPAPAWEGAGLAAGTLLGLTMEAYLVPIYSESQTHDVNGQAGDSAYYEQFWQDRDNTAHAQAIVATGIPALLWNGWDDSGFGGLDLYNALQNEYYGRPAHTPIRPGDPVTGRYQLILGNWSHGGGLDRGIMLQWYDTWLKGENTGFPVSTQTPLHVEELASGRWLNAAAYPMTNDYTAYYLDAAGLLSPDEALVPGSDSMLWAQPDLPGSTLSFTTAPFANGAMLAGPAAVVVYGTSTTSNAQLMADLYDVEPGGGETLLTRGGMLGSLRTTDPEASWTDAAGLPTRPYMTLVADEYLSAGAEYRLEFSLAPRVWSLAPGHSLRLRLSTQAEQQACEDARAAITTAAIGCRLRPGLQPTLAGGSLTVARGGSSGSFVSLPLLPYQAIPEIAAGVTPTSNGVVLPQDWGLPQPDSDGDGFADDLDNCPFASNPGQADNGGIATTLADGIGDACQCGDVSGNGIVNGQDANAVRRHGVALEPNPLFAVPGNCDVSGNGVCNGQDGNAIAREALGVTPNPSFGQRCANALAPAGG